MNTKLEKPIRLRNLTYENIVENLSHVSFGNYHLPNPNNSGTSVNNETSFEHWKNRMILRYPNAEVELIPNESWSSRVQVIDRSFQYDQSIFVKSKLNILNA